MSRIDNIKLYMTDWAGGSARVGFISSDAPASEEVYNWLAEETICYCGINETPQNIKAYAITVRQMFQDGDLKLTNGWLELT